MIEYLDRATNIKASITNNKMFKQYFGSSNSQVVQSKKMPFLGLQLKLLLPLEVFKFDWKIEKKNFTYKIVLTYNGEIQEWTVISADQVAKKLKESYPKEELLVNKVKIIKHTKKFCPIEGFGLEVTHAMTNDQGVVITTENKVSEVVKRHNVDVYKLKADVVNGMWTDFHRFPPNDDLTKEETKIASQYWYLTKGLKVHEINFSGYTIKKVIKPLPEEDIVEVVIEKFPAKVNINKIQAKAGLGNASVKFQVKKINGMWVEYLQDYFF